MKYKKVRAKTVRKTKGWTRSLVKRGIHRNLKVIAVEVGRLVQHRQHILNQIRETKRLLLKDSERESEVSVGERLSLYHSQETCLAGCPEHEDAALHCSVSAAGLATGATLPPLLETETVPQTESHLGQRTEE